MLIGSPPRFFWCKVKTLFTIDGKIVLQQYDDWVTWLDLVDVRVPKHRETLLLILLQQEVEKIQVFYKHYP